RVCNVKLKELVKADEIFITSSIKLILPVQSVTSDRIYRYKTGPLTKRLQKLLRERITEDIRKVVFGPQRQKTRVSE
ncbi:MAG: hypothetical protein JSU69_04280, partial [Candidatus Zixiibacteriota bacterium]